MLAAYVDGVRLALLGDVMKTWKMSVSCVAASGGLVVLFLGIGPALAAPPQNIPEGGDPTIIHCDEGDLAVTVTGKFKELVNDSGVKYLSPGQKATVTNEAGESRTYTITGTQRPGSLVDGERTVRATGVNLLTAETADYFTELFYVSGNVTYVVDAGGNEIKRFEGPGRSIDLCEDFA